MPRADQNARNRNCIEHMLKYCDQIQETLDAIQNNKEAFLASHIYQNAVAMCILQLGELTKQLTPEFTAAHRQMACEKMTVTADTLDEAWEKAKRRFVRKFHTRKMYVAITGVERIGD